MFSFTPLFMYTGNYVCVVFKNFCHGLIVIHGLVSLDSGSSPPMAPIVGVLVAPKRPSACHMERPLSWVVMVGDPTLVLLSLLQRRANCLGFEIPGYV